MKKDKCPPCKKTSIGGQALMEGIMMRGPKKTAMAVRNPQGEIVLEIKQNETKVPLITKIPVARGVYNFAMSMIQGYKCLMRSAEISGLEEAEEEMRREAEAKKAAKAAKKAAKKGQVPVQENADPLPEAPVAEEMAAEQPAQAVTEPVIEEVAEPTAEEVAEEATVPQAPEAPAAGPKKEKKKADSASVTTTLVMVVGVVLGLGLAILLFKFVPTALFDLLATWIPALKPADNVALGSFIQSLVEGIFKIAIVVGYMAAVSLMKDIRRTFQYHGAEHKSIFCYEAGLELTVENVRKQRRFHPRCGTSFLILMVLVNVFVSFFIEPSFVAIFGGTMKEVLGEIHKILPTLVRSGISLVLLPLVMGIGYELLKLAGRYDNFLTRLISLPGVWLQHITVLEPDDGMIECAIAAIKEVIPEDESDKW